MMIDNEYLVQLLGTLEQIYNASHRADRLLYDIDFKDELTNLGVLTPRSHEIRHREYFTLGDTRVEYSVSIRTKQKYISMQFWYSGISPALVIDQHIMVLHALSQYRGFLAAQTANMFERVFDAADALYYAREQHPYAMLNDSGDFPVNKQISNILPDITWIGINKLNGVYLYHRGYSHIAPIELVSVDTNKLFADADKLTPELYELTYEFMRNVLNDTLAMLPIVEQTANDIKTIIKESKIEKQLL